MGEGQKGGERRVKGRGIPGATISHPNLLDLRGLKLHSLFDIFLVLKRSYLFTMEDIGSCVEVGSFDSMIITLERNRGGKERGKGRVEGRGIPRGHYFSFESGWIGDRSSFRSLFDFFLSL